jgi:hypothetical protein
MIAEKNITSARLTLEERRRDLLDRHRAAKLLTVAEIAMMIHHEIRALELEPHRATDIREALFPGRAPLLLDRSELYQWLHQCLIEQLLNDELKFLALTHGGSDVY